MPGSGSRLLLRVARPRPGSVTSVRAHLFSEADGHWLGGSRYMSTSAAGTCVPRIGA